MPKLSVVIPVYGVEKYIERCARSLFEQTLDDIEYIFVDDCTPDKSIEILNAIIEEYRPRFAREKKTLRIVRMPTNSGLAAVRRHGIQFCTGEYIIHCDSDDWVETDMYELMYNEAKRIDADMVFCGYRTTDGVNVQQEYYHTHTDKDEILRSMLTMAESWSTWTKICKKSLYVEGIIYPQYAMGEDMVLILQIVLKSNKFGIVNKVLYNYYSNPASITKNQIADTQFRHRVEATRNVSIVLSVFDSYGLTDKYSKELLMLKYQQKRQAAHLAIQKKYSKAWLSIFPEIDSKVWHLAGVSTKDKLRYYVALIVARVNALCHRDVKNPMEYNGHV